MEKGVSRLLNYFSGCREVFYIGESVGMEVETHFVDKTEQPVTIQQSQLLLQSFLTQYGWNVWKKKSDLITEIRDGEGNKILYELGRQNIEVVSAANRQKKLIKTTREILEKLYRVGQTLNISPCFYPILDTEEDLLVIPDERDAVWLELDGRPALELLARASAVQFTVAVSPEEVMGHLRKLGRALGVFLEDYPQEVLWRRYIKESRADYHTLRYGGPLFFQDIEDYCERLAEHKVVSGSGLLPHDDSDSMDVSLFLRSVWWYFRLKRYGGTLCIEVRPMARRSDDKLRHQLEMVLDIMF